MSTKQADPATLTSIQIAANKAGVDPALLQAIYAQESTSDPYQEVVNDGGTPAYGPFQVHLDRARDNGFTGDPNEMVSNPLYGDPNYPDAPPTIRALDALPTNVDIAAQALAQNNDACNGDLSCLAAGYRLPGSIRGSHPISPQQLATTQNYTNSVMQHYSDIKGSTFTGENIINLKARNSLGGGAPGKSRRYSPDRVDGPNGAPVYEGHCLEDEQEQGLFPEGAPLPPNPNHATCQFQIGGTRNAQNGLLLGTGVSLTPARPQYLEYFEYVDVMSSWLATFRVRIFDPSWDIAAGENTLHALQQARTESGTKPSATDNMSGLESILLSWGYVGYPGEQLLAAAFQQFGMWSGIRQAFLIGYSPRFLGTGVEIELTGQSTNLSARLKSRSVTYPTRPGAVSVSDIVKQIAIRNGWRYCIRPTLLIYESGEPKKFTQAMKDDITYIQYDLIPFARAADNPDETGYVVYYNSQSNTLHFHPPRTGQIWRHYTYSRQRHGTVISFNPHIQPAVVVAAGGVRLEVAGMDQKNKEFYTHVLDHKLVGDPSGTAPGTFVPQRVWQNDPDPVNRIVTADAGTKDAAFSEALSMYRTQQWAAVEADLTVVGDPTVRAGQRIRVTVFGKDGMPHWASGVFVIQQATHVIERGQYTTTYQLYRDSLPANTLLSAQFPSTGTDQSTQANPTFGA